jgi:predicted dehydrogenase
VVGVGVFGRNHARVYQELEQQGEPVRLVGVVDTNLDRADAVAREFGCRAFGSIDQMLTTHSEIRAASVAAPTLHHLNVARTLMECGVDVLIEKPLGASLAEADKPDISSASIPPFAPPFLCSRNLCFLKSTA